jgi:hypothetical protein
MCSFPAVAGKNFKHASPQLPEQRQHHTTTANKAPTSASAQPRSVESEVGMNNQTKHAHEQRTTTAGI